MQLICRNNYNRNHNVTWKFNNLHKFEASFVSTYKFFSETFNEVGFTTILKQTHFAFYIFPEILWFLTQNCAESICLNKDAPRNNQAP